MKKLDSFSKSFGKIRELAMDKEYSARVKEQNLYEFGLYLKNKFPNFSKEQLNVKDYDNYVAVLNSNRKCKECTGYVKEFCNGYRYTTIQDVSASGEISYGVYVEECPFKTASKKAKDEMTLIDQSYIPKHRRENSFTNFYKLDKYYQVELALISAKECARLGKSLILGGGVGTGKTHLTIAMGMEYLSQNKSVIFFNIAELWDKLRIELLANESELKERVKSCELLILDDLGVEKLSEWRGEQLYEIVNHRYNNNLPIAITTNAINMADLKDKLGSRAERIVSRLNEMCTAVWLNHAPDYRMFKKQSL